MTIPPVDRSRLSLNQITTEQWDVDEVIAGCVAAGIGWLGVWRHKVEPFGVERAARLLADAGLRVSSLCRGGFFPAPSEAERRRRLDDNRRAVDEAARLRTDVLVLVCGPAPDRDIDWARRQIDQGVEELAPYAAERGVRLGIEPLHPMMAAERSAVVTLAEANRIAARFPAGDVGVVVDAYHVWWDPELYRQIDAAGGRIVGFHVSDWTVPTTSLLEGRGIMGQGVIELRRLRQAVEKAGYAGPIEVEVINRELWQQPGAAVLGDIVEAFVDHL